MNNIHSITLSGITSQTATCMHFNWPWTCTLCYGEDWKLCKKAQIPCTSERIQHPKTHITRIQAQICTKFMRIQYSWLLSVLWDPIIALTALIAWQEGLRTHKRTHAIYPQTFSSTTSEERKLWRIIQLSQVHMESDC